MIGIIANISKTLFPGKSYRVRKKAKGTPIKEDVITAAIATSKLFEKLSMKRLLAKKLVKFRIENFPSTVKASINTTNTGYNNNTTNNDKTTKKIEKDRQSVPLSLSLGNLANKYAPRMFH
ncbi:hypothetical protein DRO66_04705 [Candidatus Bathyarchaeota archaeon]|jgi:hypothetical protein|nr:MAG: hypothetical protein DRO66_04705 [Candidatus Bathyarchaeota archaeon]